jgi:hypothetical protein
VLGDVLDTDEFTAQPKHPVEEQFRHKSLHCITHPPFPAKNPALHWQLLGPESSAFALQAAHPVKVQ